MNKKIKKMEDVVTIPMTKYVTTDGKEFTDDYDANMHQAHLDSMAEAKLCFEKYGIYTSDLMIKIIKIMIKLLAMIIFLLASYIQIYQVMMICISYRQKMRKLKKKF